MIEQFQTHGSVVAVGLMVYAANVMIEALRREKFDRSGIYTPGIIRSSFGSLVMIASLPCAIWSAIYIGLFEAWIRDLMVDILLILH
jgi:hypothetical protein